MYKQAFGFETALQDALPLYSASISLSLAQANILDALLGPTDWTYLEIYDGASCEIVKVTSVSTGTVIVNRAASGTERKAFGAGSRVKFIPTYAGVVDYIEDIVEPLGLTITSSGSPQISSADGSIVVSAIIPTIAAEPPLEVVGKFPNFIIGEKVEAGETCCGAVFSLPIPPPVPVPLTLTGQLPAPTLGVPITPFSYVTAGGVPPYVAYTIIDGAIPTGLNYSLDNIFTGTATETGTFTWIADVEDSEGNHAQVLNTVTIAEVFFGVPFLTNIVHYEGPRNDLEPDPINVGWGDDMTLVRIAPNGIHAVASIEADTGPNRFLFSKYNVMTGLWSALALPVDMPISGPIGMAWSHDGAHLGIAMTEADPDNFILYALTGDTLAKVNTPAVRPPNGCYEVAWSPDKSRIAIANGNSGEGLYVYDFTGGAMINPRTGPTFEYGIAVKMNFDPLGRYIACGNTDGVWVMDSDPDPMVVLPGYTYASVPTPHQAGAGAFFDETGNYVIGLAQISGGNIASVYGFNGSALTFLSNAASQPATLPFDSSMTSNRGYIAMAISESPSPYIYQLSGASPPVLTHIPDPPAAELDLATVSWSDVIT